MGDFEEIEKEYQYQSMLVARFLLDEKAFERRFFISSMNSAKSSSGILFQLPANCIIFCGLGFFTSSPKRKMNEVMEIRQLVFWNLCNFIHSLTRAKRARPAATSFLP